jgi:hypothetical protein
MKTRWFLLMLLLVLVGCASEETHDVTVTVNNLQINAKNFFKVTANDLAEMEKATQAPSKKANLVLSENRKAVCQSGSCKIDGNKEHMAGNLDRKEIQKLMGYQAEAKKNSKEVKIVDGPITMKCAASDCTADLFYKASEPVSFKAKAHVKQTPDWGSVLIHSFVSGAFQAAGAP